MQLFYNPTAIFDKYSEYMTQKHNAELEIGAKVKIIAGPFTGMYGTIEEIDTPNQKLTLNVDLFGQETSVETEISQIEMARD